MSNPVLDRMQRHGLRPRKELGQHFLTDLNIIERLVECIEPRPGEAILEFGAGPGVLPKGSWMPALASWRWSWTTRWPPS